MQHLCMRRVRLNVEVLPHIPMIVVLSAYEISTSNVFCKAFQNWRANKLNKLKIDYRLFVGLHLVYRCLFILVYQKLS